MTHRGPAVDRKMCPCCGQDIAIPNELTSMHVKPILRMVLFRLYRAMPRTVSIEQLAPGSSAESVRIYICRLREALRDQGSELEIETNHGYGYYMTRNERQHDQVHERATRYSSGARDDRDRPRDVRP